jgi:hypothetical protein
VCETIFQRLCIHGDQVQDNGQRRGLILANLLQENAAPLQQNERGCRVQTAFHSLGLQFLGQIFQVFWGGRCSEEGAEALLNGLPRWTINVAGVGLEE